MEKYLQLDNNGKIVSVQGQQNVEETLILKEVSDEQMQDIFYYGIVNNELQIIEDQLYKNFINGPIDLQLRELDIKKIRPNSEINDPNVSEEIKAKALNRLKDLNAQAEVLRLSRNK